MIKVSKNDNCHCAGRTTEVGEKFMGGMSGKVQYQALVKNLNQLVH